MRLRGQRGQAVVEYAIVFPLQLMFTLAIIQLAHIFVAKHIVSYAAACGARAALVAAGGQAEADAREAAVIALSAVAGPSGAESEAKVNVPGWGDLPRSGAASLKTTTTIHDTVNDDGVPVVTCDVEHLFELTIPIGNYITYQIGEMFVAMPDAEETYGQPHLLLTGVSTLVRPWDTSNEVDED